MEKRVFMWFIWFLKLFCAVMLKTQFSSGVDLSDFGAELFILSLCPIFEKVI